jgi:hypothetical protein
MSEVTANQIIRVGLGYAGLVVGMEQSAPSLDMIEEGRQAYNSLVDGLNANGMNISHMARKTFPITPGKGDYTLGPGADWEWPSWVERIQRAGIVVVGPNNNPPWPPYPDCHPPCPHNPPCPPPGTPCPYPEGGYCPQPEYTIHPLTVDEYQGWILKKQQTNWGQYYWYERAQPYGIVHLLYVPSNANLCALYLEDAISRIDVGENPTLEDINVTGPPGFQLMLETNLGRALAARNPTKAHISEDTLELARRSLMDFQGPNSRPMKKTSDLSWGRRPNIFIGNRYNS